MDKSRDQRPAPDTFAGIPEHVRKWLNTIDQEDIDRFRKWSTFIVWFETSSRYTRGLVIFLMAGFGLYTAAATLWARWAAKG